MPKIEQRIETFETRLQQLEAKRQRMEAPRRELTRQDDRDCLGCRSREARTATKAGRLIGIGRALPFAVTRGLVNVGLLMHWAGLPALAQTSDPQSAPSSSLPVEVFEAPKLKDAKRCMDDATKNDYASAARNGIEGWVVLNFMVSTSGSVVDPMIAQTSGNRDIEKAALRALKGCAFIPAIMNGQAVDSADTLKLKFESSGATGLSGTFKGHYKIFEDAVAAHDQSSASSALSQLKPQNLFEDASLGMAQYQYAVLWETPAEQLAGLQRVVAVDDHVHSLRKDQLNRFKYVIFGLQVKLNHLADALDTWRALQELKDKETLSKVQPIVDQIEAVRASDREIASSGEIGDIPWSFNLFKQHFRVVVTRGHVGDVKLHCTKKYVFFAFDPELLYNVPSSFGSCRVILTGDPGTTFNFVES